MTLTEWLVEFDPPTSMLSMNDSQGSAWRQKQRRADKNLWVEAAAYGACAAFPGVGPAGRSLPPCEVFISLPMVGAHRRDPHNYFPTVKAIIDGLVDAQLWPDDNPAWVHTNEPTIRVVDRSEQWRAKVYVRLVAR